MKGYKYRSGSGESFELALKSIEQNYFWSASVHTLNDPFETLVGKEHFINQFKAFTKLMRSKDKEAEKSVHEALQGLIDRRDKIGIFSLSKTFRNELLWAHYGDSHFGFCIEYDIPTLLEPCGYQKKYRMDVNYAKHPSSIKLTDVSKLDQNQLFLKIFGTKSKVWSYEKEVRLVCDGVNEQSYDYKAITGIYFGVRMPEQVKESIMYKMRGRGIDFFQMVNPDGKYDLVASQHDDLFKDATPYIDRDLKNDSILPSHNIRDYDKSRYPDVGKTNVVIEQKVSKEDLINLAEQIKLKYHFSVKKLFIGFHTPEMDFNDVLWANATVTNESADVSINDWL
ncbi:MAG: hypothetical protein ACJASQ_003084 [Crocinitomicaceae bacterium]|jgi:hypothetical protein